jgi:hypothetical protein
MQWQALVKELFPKSPTSKKQYGVGQAAMFGRYFHFWSIEAVLQYRLQSHHNTLPERFEAYFASMKKILRLTSNYREDQGYLLQEAERSQMEAIHHEMQHTSCSLDREASKISHAFDTTTSPLADIELTHKEVASNDFRVLCCMFSDYLGSGDWLEVKEGSEEIELEGRRVREVIVRVTSGGDNGNAVLLSERCPL